MPYASGRVIHDADAHIMEVPGFLEQHLEARYRAQVTDAVLFPDDRGRGLHRLRPQERKEGADNTVDFDESQIMLRKNWDALGSYAKQDRPQSIDLLGFASQLMFTTALLNFSSLLEGKGDVDLIYAVARAHTRHMVDFCSVDRRLLPTGYVPLADFERTARGGARGHRARRQGAADPVALPGRPFAQPYRLRSAVGHRPGGRPADRLSCRRRREASGGGLLQQRPAAGAGLPRRRRQFQVDRLHGHRLPADEGADGADRRPRARPLPAAQVRRHRAGRLVGAGLDAQHRIRRTPPSTRTRSGCRRCRSGPASSWPARSASRPTRTRMPAGSSPTRATRSACSRRTIRTSRAAAIRIKRFEASMAAAGTSERQKQRFYCDNFVDLMGAGLAPELRAAA